MPMSSQDARIFLDILVDRAHSADDRTCCWATGQSRLTIAVIDGTETFIWGRQSVPKHVALHVLVTFGDPLTRR